MTPGKLDEIGAEPVAGDSPRPFRVNKLIVATDNVKCNRQEEIRPERTAQNRGTLPAVQAG